ncbi:MAG: dapG [Clostridiales bacterium]|jgi:aspartate kinase|nr:dapG [Clostridiales bacterium]
MGIIIQKFGGTSVSTSEKRSMVVDKVVDAISRGYSPVVVVSAIGRKGDPYATDTLLSLIEGIHNDANKREKDLLMCCGEIISAVILSEAFSSRGYMARALTGGNAGIITNNNYGNASVINVEGEKILELLSQGIIPIVTGFQGITNEGDCTTLGRGGSDITGALLGKELGAEFIEIFTDVDGVMTADPKIVPEARVIDEISYGEVFELADQGAKVVHPRAVEYAMEGNVPLLIRNTSNNCPGTTITSSKKQRDNIVTGITNLSGRTQVTINSNRASSNKVDKHIFGLLAKKHISIDLINVFPSKKVFTIDSEDDEKMEEILKQSNIDYEIIKDCSKISVLGNTMRGIPGIMAKILSIMDQNHINVLQTADSHTTIWCLIKENDKVKAMKELHNAFFS